LKKNETNSLKKKDSDEKNIRDEKNCFKDILDFAPELPTGIAYLRGMWKSKKYRRASPKRKR
jgi:hypothetical protein